MTFTTRLGFRLLLKHGNPRGLPKSFIDGMFDRFDSGTKRAVLRLYCSTNNPAEMAERFGDVFRSSDPYIPVRYAERQRDYFPSAQAVVLESSGHWPYADDPKKVAAILLPFLKMALPNVDIR